MVSGDVQVIEVPTVLEDLVHEGFFVGAAIAYPV